MTEQANNPLHGKTLEMILNELVEYYGWEELGFRINIRCFNENPSIKSSLVFTSHAVGKRESGASVPEDAEKKIVTILSPLLFHLNLHKAYWPVPAVVCRCADACCHCQWK